MSITFDNKRFNEHLSVGLRSAANAYSYIGKKGNIQDVENEVWHAVDCRSCALYDAKLEDAPEDCLPRVELFDAILDLLRMRLMDYNIEDADDVELNSYQEALAQLSEFGRALKFEQLKRTLEKL